MLFALLLTGAASQFAPTYQQIDQGSPIAFEQGQAAAQEPNQELIIELSISQQAPPDPLPATTPPETLDGTLDVFSIDTVPNPTDSIVTISLGTLANSIKTLAVASITIDPSIPTPVPAPKTESAPAPQTPQAQLETEAVASTQKELFSSTNETAVASNTHIKSHTTPVVDQGVNEGAPDGQIYDPYQTAELAVVSAPPVYSMRQDELFDMLSDYAKNIDHYYQQQDPATPAVAMEQAAQYQAQPNIQYRDTSSTQHPLQAAWTAPLGTQLVTDTKHTSSAIITAASPGPQPIEYYGDAYLTFDWMHDNWSYSISNVSAVAFHSANAARRLTPAIVKWALQLV